MNRETVRSQRRGLVSRTCSRNPRTVRSRLILNRFIGSIVFLAVGCAVAHASVLPNGDRRTTNTMPIEFLRWQALENESDYGENWSFFVQQKDGSNFYGTFTITNVGFHTYDLYVNMGFADAAGKLTKIHKEYRRDKLKASKEVFDVAIADNRAWGAPPEIHLKMNEDNMKADLTFISELPPYRLGDGKIRFDKNSNKEHAYGINMPRARATGTIAIGDTKYPIDGVGFSDHEWQTAKVTDFSRGGVFVLLWHEDVTIILQNNYLKGDNADKKMQIGLVGKAGKIVAESQSFKMDVTSKTKDKSSGYEWPEVIAVDFESNGVKVIGTLKTVEVVQNMDMLAELSWPIRFFIRTFVSNPWLRRMWANYDLNVTINGKTRHITGKTIPGALYF